MDDLGISEKIKIENRKAPAVLKMRAVPKFTSLVPLPRESMPKVPISISPWIHYMNILNETGLVELINNWKLWKEGLLFQNRGF